LCSGTYTLNSDTLTLKSKYSANDFCVIEGSQKENQLSDSILVFFKPSEQVYLTGPEIYLTVDSTREGRYHIGDSVMISNKASIIYFSCKCLYNMDWMINLKNNLHNRYALSLNLKIDNENISFANMKFIIENNKLLMLEKFYFIDIENNELVK